MTSIKVTHNAATLNTEITWTSGATTALSGADTADLAAELLAHFARNGARREPGSRFTLQASGRHEIERRDGGLVIRTEFRGGGWIELLLTEKQAGDFANTINDYVRPTPKRHRPRS